jgi:hypothetical protein
MPERAMTFDEWHAKQNAPYASEQCPYIEWERKAWDAALASKSQEIAEATCPSCRQRREVLEHTDNLGNRGPEHCGGCDGIHYDPLRPDEPMSGIPCAGAPGIAEAVREQCAAHLEQLAAVDCRRIDGLPWPENREVIQGVMLEAAASLRRMPIRQRGTVTP